MSTGIFASSDAQTAFAAILVLWLFSELIGGKIIPRIRRGDSRVQRRNIGSNTSLIIGWLVMLGTSLGLAGSGIGLLPSWVYDAGIAMMLFGIGFRQWAMAVLGRYFSGVIGVQKEQRVVQSGPYRFIRHPSYTGVLLIYLGVGFAVQSWGAIMVVLLVFVLTYGYRMMVEERVLISELGVSYSDYMKRTKRLIPFLV